MSNLIWIIHKFNEDKSSVFYFLFTTSNFKSILNSSSIQLIISFIKSKQKYLYFRAFSLVILNIFLSKKKKILIDIRIVGNS